MYVYPRVRPDTHTHTHTHTHTKYIYILDLYTRKKLVLNQDNIIL